MRESISRIFGVTETNDLEIHSTDEVKAIPLHTIIPNRYQPRSVFDEDKIDELCQTIKTHGIIQPIVVREIENGQFEIIAGERRWRACKKLELETIPAIVKNLQREGLSSIEEAFAYQKLIELHGLTQESLAQRLGKGQSTIANKLRLLHLPEACHEALRNRTITERHARALLMLKNEALQLQFLEEIIEKELNVKQTEQRIQKFLDDQHKHKKKQVRRSYSKDIRLAMNTIRQSVDMVLQSGLSIETEEQDHEDYYEFKIKIPKK